MIGFKMSFKKYTQIYDSISEIFRDFYYTISEELNYQFIFPFSPHFSQLYMHYTYTVKNLLYLC